MMIDHSSGRSDPKHIYSPEEADEVLIGLERRDDVRLYAGDHGPMPTPQYYPRRGASCELIKSNRTDYFAAQETQAARLERVRMQQEAERRRIQQASDKREAEWAVLFKKCAVELALKDANAFILARKKAREDAGK
jgi:hypothetical protein